MKQLLILCFYCLTVSLHNNLSAQTIKITPVYTAPHSSELLSPIVQDSVLYFAQNSRTSFWKANYDTKGKPFFKIFRIPLKNKKPLGVPQSLFTDNMPYHRSAITFNPVSRQIMVTQSSYDNAKRARKTQKKNTLTIVQYESSSALEKRPKPLNVEIGKNFNIAYPTLSADGNSMVFVSNVPNADGNTDLFVSKKTETGWSEPTSLGPNINTTETETAPFFHPSGKLFFASNGRPDGTNMDLYYTYATETGYATPIKMDSLYNSTGNDYGLYLNDDESWGYLISDRAGSDQLFFLEETAPTFDSTQVFQPDNYCFTFFENSAEQYDSEQFNFKWTFSDGHEANGIETDHCLPGPGIYQITLDVYDKISNEQLFTVSQFELNLQKTRQINFILPQNIRAGQLVSISASTEALNDITPKDFFWTIGNSNGIRGKTIQHIFPKPGEYLLKCGTLDANNPSKKLQTSLKITVHE